MRTLTSFGLCLLFAISSFAFTPKEPQWGPTGHRTIGEIASDHLSNRARKKIEMLLDGHSLAYVSTFGDEIKSDKRYDKYYTWHYVNFPIGSRYEDSKKEEKGDIMTGQGGSGFPFKTACSPHWRPPSTPACGNSRGPGRQRHQGNLAL